MSKVAHAHLFDFLSQNKAIGNCQEFLGNPINKSILMTKWALEVQSRLAWHPASFALSKRLPPP